MPLILAAVVALTLFDCKTSQRKFGHKCPPFRAQNIWGGIPWYDHHTLQSEFSHKRATLGTQDIGNGVTWYHYGWLSGRPTIGVLLSRAAAG